MFHARCAAARGELISYRMLYNGIYHRRRRYHILPEAKYIDEHLIPLLMSFTHKISPLPRGIFSYL